MTCSMFDVLVSFLDDQAKDGLIEELLEEVHWLRAGCKLQVRTRSGGDISAR